MSAECELIVLVMMEHCRMNIRAWLNTFIVKLGSCATAESL